MYWALKAIVFLEMKHCLGLLEEGNIMGKEE